MTEVQVSLLAGCGGGRRLGTLFVSALTGLTMVILGNQDEASGWGLTGHRLISGLGVRSLPVELPPFLRSADVVATIEELGPELDRSKDAGSMHDAERNSGHYVNVDDNGLIVGTVPLNALPETREEYDKKLRGGGSSQYQAGYLPYAIIDGWQQIRKDFALWRAATIGAALAADATDRAWFEADRKLREMLIVRDIG